MARNPQKFPNCRFYIETIRPYDPERAFYLDHVILATADVDKVNFCTAMWLEFGDEVVNRVHGADMDFMAFMVEEYIDRIAQLPNCSELKKQCHLYLILHTLSQMISGQPKTLINDKYHHLLLQLLHESTNKIRSLMSQQVGEDERLTNALIGHVYNLMEAGSPACDLPIVTPGPAALDTISRAWINNSGAEMNPEDLEAETETETANEDDQTNETESNETDTRRDEEK